MHLFHCEYTGTQMFEKCPLMMWEFMVPLPECALNLETPRRPEIVPLEDFS